VEEFLETRSIEDRASLHFRLPFFIIFSEWEKELEQARRKNRKPHFRNALFRTFWRSCVVDGLLVLTFTLLKSIGPVFFAQLLVQFQQPRNAITNGTSLEFNETETALSNGTASGDDDVLDYLGLIW
jgi:hypothetical protein